MPVNKIAYQIKVLIILAVLGMGLVLGLRFLFPLLAPFLLGIVFACLIEPMVRKLEIFLKIKRKLAIGILLISLILLMLGFTYMITVAFIREAQRLLPQFPVIFNKISCLIEKFYQVCILKLPQLKESLPYFNLNPESSGQILRSIIKWAAHFLTLFPQTLFTIGLGGVTAYFFSRDKQLLTRMMYRNLPNHWMTPLVQIKNEIIDTVAKFIKTELILVSITAFLTFLIFILLKLPGALIYGLLAGMLDFAPGVGTGLLYFPFIAILVLNKSYYPAVGLLGGYFFVLFIRQMSEVKIMGENLNFHPLLTIFVIYVGIKLFGFSGIFFGPVLIIILRAFYNVIRTRGVLFV